MPNFTVQFLQHNNWPIPKNSRDRVVKGNKLINGKLLSSESPKFLLNEPNSLSVAISSELQHWLGRCSLDLENNANHIVKTFFNIINEMKDFAKCKGDELSTVIYGNNFDNWNVLNTIVETFEGENIKPSLLIGDSNLSSYLRKNKLTIWGNPIGELGLKQDANSFEIQKQVEKVLNCVERPDNIEFTILENLPLQAKPKIKA